MRHKLKIKTLNKSYRYSDSIFYLLTTKKKLSNILGIELKCLKQLKHDSNYNVFTVADRAIHEPTGLLNKAHTHIASLLCRIKQPDYVHSGIKGKSHITNARTHLGDHKLLTIDLKNFFSSTTRHMVFDFFYKKMRCSADVSDLLSYICTYDGFVPTGSRLSMPIAYWANERMFNALYSLSCSKNIEMTLFVDDIAFSGDSIDKNFIYKLNKIITSYGQKMHPNKTKTYHANQPKLVTGVMLVGDKTKARNANLKKIHQDMVLWLALSTDNQSSSLNKRLIGRLNSQSKIDEKFKGKAISLKQKMNAL